MSEGGGAWSASCGAGVLRIARSRRSEDHRPTGGSLKFTRAQSGQKLQRSGAVQIAHGLIPDPHSYRIRAAGVGWLRDQQRRTPMGVLGETAVQLLKLDPLLGVLATSNSN